MPFTPGHQLATGRPPGSKNAQTLAKKHVAEAIRTQVRLMRGRGTTHYVLDKAGTRVEVTDEVPASVQLQATIMIIERAEGKPIQPIDTGGMMQLTDQAATRLIELINACRQRAAITDQSATIEGEYTDTATDASAHDAADSGGDS